MDFQLHLTRLCTTHHRNSIGSSAGSRHSKCRNESPLHHRTSETPICTYHQLGWELERALVLVLVSAQGMAQVSALAMVLEQALEQALE